MILKKYKEYTLGYSYFDECFGINIDLIENLMKKITWNQDILTIMFSFKNIGSYKSNNLAISSDKQDIDWESYSIENDKFEKF